MEAEQEPQPAALRDEKFPRLREAAGATRLWVAVLGWRVGSSCVISFNSVSWFAISPFRQTCGDALSGCAQNAVHDIDMPSANPFGDASPVESPRERGSPLLNPFASPIIAQPDIDDEATIIAQIASISNPFDDVLSDSTRSAATSEPFPPDVEPGEPSVVAVNEGVPAPDRAEADAPPGEEAPVLPVAAEDGRPAEVSVANALVESEIANPFGEPNPFAEPHHEQAEPEAEPEPEPSKDPLSIELVEIAAPTFAADVSRGCAALLESGQYSDLLFVTAGGENQRAHRVVLELRCGAAVVQVR